MTKYDDLSAVAVAVASRFNAIETLCELRAAHIVQRLVFRLGAPADRVGTLEVDENLNPTGSVQMLGSKPKVRQAQDGRLYFGLRVTYV